MIYSLHEGRIPLHLMKIYESRDNSTLNNAMKVNPTISVGEIMLGKDSRSNIRKKLGEPKNTFKKVKLSPLPETDNYDNFHIFYSKDDIVEAVEIHDGELIINNNNLVIGDYIGHAKSIFSDLTDESGYDDYVSQSDSVGISTSKGKITSICFGVKGYYNRLDDKKIK